MCFRNALTENEGSSLKKEKQDDNRMVHAVFAGINSLVHLQMRNEWKELVFKEHQCKVMCENKILQFSMRSFEINSSGTKKKPKTTTTKTQQQKPNNKNKNQKPKQL